MTWDGLFHIRIASWFTSVYRVELNINIKCDLPLLVFWLYRLDFLRIIINTEHTIGSFLNTYLFCLSRRTERAPYCTSIWHAPGWLVLAASNKGDLPSWKGYQKSLQHLFGFNFKIEIFSHSFLYSVQNELLFQNLFDLLHRQHQQMHRCHRAFWWRFCSLHMLKNNKTQDVIIFRSTLTARHYIGPWCITMK